MKELNHDASAIMVYFQDLSEIGQPPPGNNPSNVSITNNQINSYANWGLTIDAADAGVCNNTHNWRRFGHEYFRSRMMVINKATTME